MRHKTYLLFILVALLPSVSFGWVWATSNVVTVSTNAAWTTVTSSSPSLTTSADDGLLNRVVLTIPPGITNLSLQLIETGSGILLYQTNNIPGSTNATTTVVYSNSVANSVPFFRKTIQTKDAMNGPGSNNLQSTIYILRIR